LKITWENIQQDYFLRSLALSISFFQYRAHEEEDKKGEPIAGLVGTQPYRIACPVFYCFLLLLLGNVAVRACAWCLFDVLGFDGPLHEW
jgi:hypothetical protein